MKVVYRTFSSAMIVACAGLLISAPRAHAQWAVDCVNCSTSWLQTLQYAQQVETAANTAQQLETQIQQYRNMLLQGASLPQSEFRQLASNIQQIQSLYNQSAALAGNMSNFDSRFQSQFPGYRTYLQETGTNPDYAQNFYKEWTLQGLDSNRTAMAVAGNNVNEIPSEDRTLSKLVNQSQSALGRLQAIQAGNQIAAQQVQQMQKLREMVNAQIQNESLYYAQNIKRRAVDAASTENYQSGSVANDPAQSF